MAGKVILLLLRLALGGVFLYAGIVKVTAAQDFAGDIQRYRLLPWPSAAILLAIYLPWLEILSGAAVILRRLYPGALAVIAAMMLLFTLALTSAWARGLDIQCGCFGRKKESIRTNFPALLARDLALLATAGVLLAAEWRAGRKRADSEGSS